ncbi:MAG: hypothetical protein QOF89_6032 [Acidobacteriota bacterium]|jgi:hypothetical protein|nr:hypothetical protein [Acidobacteriota bacterium]
MVAAGLLVTAILVVGNSMGHAQTISRDDLPKDADLTCSADVNSWFKNGVPQPADGVNFPDATNCDFYRWSEQMFLWLTSPDPASKNGGRVIDSAEFYDVSLPNADGERTFLPHVPGAPLRTFNLRSAQAGPHGLQVLFDKAGKMFEIAPTRKAPSGRPLVLDKLGKLVEVASARMKDGKPVFLDKASHPIASPKPSHDALAALSLKGAKATALAYRFMIGKTPIFLDADGAVINTAVGQADTNGVLMAQNRSLVYYVTMVNDVFAYFLTGAKDDDGIKPDPTQFPTTPEDLQKVIDFASSRGKKLKNPQALAIEVKSSWVEATSLPNPDDYITMEAYVPFYHHTPNKWVLVPNAPPQHVTLAMVGMHVVGSVKGNPEMLWATFEHFGNTPNAAYDYIASGGHQKTVKQNTAGTWLFSASDATEFNAMHMKVEGGNIEGVDGHAITRSNTLRMKPWGGAFNSKPNGKVTSTAASNSEIIAINNSVLGQLSAGDVRKNYFMVGNTWTKGGIAPTRPYPGSGAQVEGQEVGTSQLANSTMETYDQETTSYSRFTNCFSCHAPKFEGDPLTSVSHIYKGLLPLPPV